MKIIVDKSLCSGHARCFAVAPRLYTIDELGYSAIDELDVPSGLEDEARRGADACPERAIRIVERKKEG
jgi:ferredoxin